MCLRVGGHHQDTKVRVNIRVKDVNDNPPEFATNNEVLMCESALPGKVGFARQSGNLELDWMFLLLIEDVFAPVIQIIETISAVDKDEMGHRQHFTFSLAPEVAHNHNFSIKDNRGKTLESYFGLFTHPSCRIFLVLQRHSQRLPPFSEIRSKRDQMEARNTRGEQQVL